MLQLSEHSPRSMEEAIALLESTLTDLERQAIDREGAEMFHFGPGMAIRNEWLHPKGSILAAHFINRFGWLHADDMSGLILAGLTARVRGEEFNPDPMVARYKRHWSNNGINPNTGEEL